MTKKYITLSDAWNTPDAKSLIVFNPSPEYTEKIMLEVRYKNEVVTTIPFSTLHMMLYTAVITIFDKKVKIGKLRYEHFFRRSFDAMYKFVYSNQITEAIDKKITKQLKFKEEAGLL